MVKCNLCLTDMIKEGDFYKCPKCYISIESKFMDAKLPIILYDIYDFYNDL